MSELKVIATIKTDFPTKFGIPRQSGLVFTKEKIVFEKEYRVDTALRGLEDFSHLWLIWAFSENKSDGWSPTVRPPRLGGNKRVGVFATRSPNRPNPIGLSSVKIEKIYNDGENGTVIEVSGADLLDGTPIYDIKPYLAFTDSHPEAKGGFADNVLCDNLTVEFLNDTKDQIHSQDLENLIKILQSDPRPHYQNDDRVYAFEYAKYHIEFKVSSNVLTVTKVQFLKDGKNV
ncbi:MAG: tRNA (N6-threonylcarbamoyladenosine(37)-N6)-methyltransferase TrmO [Ruminococcaceae bacterium]|nr:tRNA (N6-threonylcarbamoyladenosine(37)-N6)-methyltransferase TrmO [Oscillospiraceae bacterium]